MARAGHFAGFTTPTTPAGSGYLHHLDSFDFSHNPAPAGQFGERMEQLLDRLDRVAGNGHDAVQHFFDSHPHLAQVIENFGHFDHNTPWVGHDDWAI
jgi:hypothetical protein